MKPKRDQAGSHFQKYTPIDRVVARTLYESGKSGSEVAKILGADPSAINRLAKKFEWSQVTQTTVPKRKERNKQVLAAVSERVSEELVRRIHEEVVTVGAIRDAAMTIVQVVNKHREIASTGRALAYKMINQLIADSDRRKELQNLIIEDLDSDAVALKRERYLAAISLAGHADTLKTISMAAANFVKIEREAFNIGDVLPSDASRVPPEVITPDEAADTYRRMIG